MTSVVAAGNGFLSGGLYRGIASGGGYSFGEGWNVVAGSSLRSCARGIRWVIRHREEFKIRIINISAGGDFEASYLTDDLSQAAEEATRAGMLVIAAAGNSGHMTNHPVLPPASAPSVIAVGGLDDKNNPRFFGQRYVSLESTVRRLTDLQKPELIAPGIWIAAPILPGTPTAEQAVLLSKLESASHSELREIIKQNAGVDEDLNHAADLARVPLEAGRMDQDTRQQRDQRSLQTC